MAERSAASGPSKRATKTRGGAALCPGLCRAFARAVVFVRISPRSIDRGTTTSTHRRPARREHIRPHSSGATSTLPTCTSHPRPKCSPEGWLSPRVKTYVSHARRSPGSSACSSVTPRRHERAPSQLQSPGFDDLHRKTSRGSPDRSWGAPLGADALQTRFFRRNSPVAPHVHRRADASCNPPMNGWNDPACEIRAHPRAPTSIAC